MLAFCCAVFTFRIPCLSLDTYIYTDDNDDEIDSDRRPFLISNMLDDTTKNHARVSF